jgi:alkylation response protein AidB-like acyl-CoA dehydrogenase
MTDYRVPLSDIEQALAAQSDLAGLRDLDRYREAAPDLVSAVLGEAARFAERTLGPLNEVGDRHGCQLENGVVRTAPGFAEAYRAFAQQGWQGVPADTALGGQGLPWSIAAAVQEMWYAANMSFSLCPLLTQGAIDLLETHASPAQRERYLRPLIEGRWTGTMNMTEPGAGSDVGALTTRAVPDGDGWRISGQKIFITFGEHDMAENIVHLVLARAPNAPVGSKGISLFIVPKFLPNKDGSPGVRNHLRCIALERKMGIHASPTCVMSYGDDGGAWGELVGEVNQGMALMFTMMNNARLAVAIQGLGAGERAWQAAIAYAHQRRQGRLPGIAGSAPIVRHPDVARMLMTIRALVDAKRALIYFTAGAMDRARALPAGDERDRAQALTDLLTPIAKAWCTDRGCEAADIAIQVHGGMGFIEQTGAAQIYRDARITPIYEGTNGIQAIDLLGRKLCRDDGRAVAQLCIDMRRSLEALPLTDLPGTATKLVIAAIERLESASESLLAAHRADPREALAAATDYLRFFGNTIAAWRLAIAAFGNAADSSPDSKRRQESALFFATHVLPETIALAAKIQHAIAASPDLPVALSVDPA